MKNILLAALVIFAACTTKVDPNDIDKLDWLIGTWEGKAGDATFYEHWSKISATELRNINFELVNGDTANSHYASILVRDGDILYKGSSELKATALDSTQVTFHNKEEKRKYIFRLDDQGRWVAILDNAGANVTYELTRTTPLDEMLRSKMDTIPADTMQSDTTVKDTMDQ